MIKIRLKRGKSEVLLSKRKQGQGQGQVLVGWLMGQANWLANPTQFGWPNEVWPFGFMAITLALNFQVVGFKGILSYAFLLFD